MILDSIHRSLQLSLAAPVATRQLEFAGYYNDGSALLYNPEPFAGASHDATPVTMVPAPGVGVQRQVAMYTVSNLDSAVATATVSFDDDGDLTDVIVVDMNPGDTLVYTQSDGFSVKSRSGALKQTVESLIQLTGDVTGQGVGTIATTIPAGSIGTAKLADAGVTSDKIAPNAVTYAKLQQEGASSLLGNPTGAAASASEISLGTQNKFLNSKLISTFNYLDYDYANATSGADVTTSLQNFLISCYLNAVTYGALRLSNVAQRTMVRAVCDATWPLLISSPEIVPPFVGFDFASMLKRSYPPSGSVTNFYNGDTTSKALLNPYQPMLVVAAAGHLLNWNPYANPDDVHQGAGAYAVRGWRMAGNPAIGSPGSGYTNGDTVTIVNPHSVPYASATFSLTVVGGVVTAATLVSGGVWPMPPKLLRQAWTSAQWLASQNPVFDGSGRWLATGGTGAGLTLVVADDATGWEADFAGGVYTADNYSLQTDTLIGTGRAQGVGQSTDGTYGPMRAFRVQGLNFYPQSVSTSGGYYGVDLSGTDVVGGDFYNTNAFVQFKKNGGSNLCQVSMTCDTPATGGHYFELDKADLGVLNLRCFNGGARDITGASYSGLIGSMSNAGFGVVGEVKAQFENAGTSQVNGDGSKGIPALFADYAHGLTIDAQVVNLQRDGTVVPTPNSRLIDFGTHNGPGNRLTGSVDWIPGPLYSGDPTGWGIEVYDGYVGGWMRDGGVYDITGTGAPVNGTSGTGAKKAIVGSTYTDKATGLAYVNTGTATNLNWVLAGPIASQTIPSGTMLANLNTTTAYANVAALPVGQTLTAGCTINGLGDSITAQPRYQASTVPPAGTPAWLPSHDYTAEGVGYVVQNGGYLYRLKTAGTSASSGGPTTFGASIADNTCVWTHLNEWAVVPNTSFFWWVEKLSGGRVNFNQYQGYNGTLNGVAKALIQAAGSGYVNPYVTLNGGAVVSVQQSGGKIVGATVADPGYAYSGSITVPVLDSGGPGTGGALTLVFASSGTFGVPGAWTRDMVAMLPDACASTVDVFTVFGGTNDVSNGQSAASIVANLKTCYETLLAAGKKVVAITVLPRDNFDSAKAVTAMRVNRWIRNYVKKRQWADPLGMNIGLADPVPYWLDATATGAAVNGSVTFFEPIGGKGGVPYAMTQEGTHPVGRGAAYIGWPVWEAIQQWMAPAPAYPAQGVCMTDGYDPNLNPSGCFLEGLPWTASTAYSNLQGLVVNDSGKVYRLTTAGTSATSGGPTGTGTSIADGTCVWRYVRQQGMSVFAAGSTALSSPPAGIAYSGSLANGYSLARTAGSASGTVNGAIENPWSNGQVGNRQVLSFSLGGGTVDEEWKFILINGGLPTSGISLSDLGTAYYFAECEVELSGVANLCHIFLEAGDETVQFFNQDGIAKSPLTQGWQMPASNGEMLDFYSEPFLLRTQPMLFPSNMASMALWLQLGFNASGAAGSATATVKINNFAIRKANVL